MLDNKNILITGVLVLLESDPSIGQMCEYGFSYNSGTNKIFLSIEEIKNLINKNT